MEVFNIVLGHSSGNVTIKTSASNKEQAIKQALKFENAPRSSILEVERQ